MPKYETIKDKNGNPFERVEIKVNSLLEIYWLFDLTKEEQDEEMRNFIKSITSGICDLETYGGNLAYTILKQEKKRQETRQINGKNNILKRWNKE